MRHINQARSPENRQPRISAAAVRCPKPTNTPMANLLLGLLDKAGVPEDSFGDSTGRVDLEPLSLTSNL